MRILRGIRMMLVRMITRATCHCELRATCFPEGGVPTPWMHDWHKGMHYAPSDGRQHKLNKINMHWILHPSMHVAMSTPQLTDKNSYDTPKFHATTLTFVLNMKGHPKSHWKRTREWQCVCFFAFELTFMLVVVVVVGYTCTVWVQPPRIV